MLDQHELSTLRRGLVSELAYARRSAWSVVHATTEFVCDALAQPDLDRDELRACMADLKAVVATAERRTEGYERLLACVDVVPRRPASLEDLLEAAGQTAGLVVEIIWPPGSTAAEFDADVGWIHGLKSHFGQVFRSELVRKWDAVASGTRRPARKEWGCTTGGGCTEVLPHRLGAPRRSRPGCIGTRSRRTIF